MSTELTWYGPQYISDGWAPAPRYLLRRARIHHHMKTFPPGKLVEVGCASGALLSELSSWGFECTGIESSSKAISLARKVNEEQNIDFREAPDPGWSSQFDYCLAFEVLEHIEHDHEALKEWAGWMKPGGKMLLSVPAHPKLWNARDVWAGHYRRYRKKDLEEAFAAAGLRIQTIESYGFPLANILELIFARSANKEMSEETKGAGNIDKAAQTAESGIERSTHIKMFRYYTKVPGAWIMRAMMGIQNLFLGTSIGNGYFVIATKPL